MPNTKPLVSILIPTYNGEKYLCQALESIVKQVYPNIEVIICDDASDDRTSALAKRFIKKFRKGEMICAAKHQGIGNWNRCLQRAKGKYIKFLFQDDLLVPKAVASFVAFAEVHPAVGLFTSNQVLINQHGRYIKSRQPYKKNMIFPGERVIKRLLVKGNYIGGPTSVFIRSEVVKKTGGFNESLLNSVDIEFWIRLLAQTKLGWLAAILNKSRLHPQSLTNMLKKKNIDIVDNFKFLEIVFPLTKLKAILTKKDRKQILKARTEFYWKRLLYCQRWKYRQWIIQCFQWCWQRKMRLSTAIKTSWYVYDYLRRFPREESL